MKAGAVAAALAVASLCAGARAGDFRALVHAQNMERLRCAMPEEGYRMTASSAPGQLFHPGEAVGVTLAIRKGDDSGAVGDYAVEIQEIVQRRPDPADPEVSGAADFGPPDRIAPEGRPVRKAIEVRFDDAREAVVEVRDLPVPERFGVYALILTRGRGANGARRFLGTVARVPRPRRGGDAGDAPVLGEAQIFDRRETYERRAGTYERMGVRLLRREASWSENKDGSYRWDDYDAFFKACGDHNLKLMITLGGHPWHFLPFGEPTPASNYTGSPYWGCGDWLCAPELYPRYGRWIEAFCERYWKRGEGALWGIEHYNEPWEGGGISGWARDCIEYRKLMKLIADSARKVDRRIKICGCSSIMNTEDKLYSDGSREFDKYIDIFTDHYVPAPICYGPMVAKAHGKESMDTESWMGNAEYRVPLAMVMFTSCGQKRVNPWHPRALYDTVPGSGDRYFAPTPVVTASAAFNWFATGKPFTRMVFHEHLPWLFQYGKDDDPEALLVMFGQLVSFGAKSPQERAKDRLWSQVDTVDGGTITVDNADGLLRFYDTAGNRMLEGQKSVSLPMSYLPTYIKCARGPAAAAKRLARARIAGKRPVEIIPRDFSAYLSEWDAEVRVAVHNCMPFEVSGTLAVRPPEAVRLATERAYVRLAAGETKEVSFSVASARPDPANVYPFEFRFTSPAGDAAYSEDLNVAVAPRRRIRVDGDLADWEGVPGVTLFAAEEKLDVTEKARRPWIEWRTKEPDGTFAEVRLAWDDANVYVSARVNDPTPQTNHVRMETRDDDMYFHDGSFDTKPHYKEFMEKRPGRSLKETPWVYCRPPHDALAPPWGGDRLHFAFDVKEGWHDLVPAADVPFGYHASPDTDYEYALYLCADGKGELWRMLAPGVPRIHDFPRQPKGEVTTGTVEGAKHVVRQDGKVRIYELSLPREAIPDLDLRAGAEFGFTFMIGNNEGPNVFYGADKAVTKTNGLTLHPYWWSSPSCGVRWTLAE